MTDTKRRRAVVCDDDPTARRVIISLIEEAGYELLTEAGLAVEALEMVEHFKPDVLVIDVAMPGMSGTEALSKVADLSADTRVVIVSAFDIDAAQARADGAYAVVDKTDLGGLVGVLAGIDEVASP